MLHTIDEIDAPTATAAATLTSTPTTTAIMAPTETTGNGTEPTISTHLANATATIEPTTTVANATAAVTNNISTPLPLTLSAAVELTELATTADGVSVASLSQQTDVVAETEAEPAFDVQMRTQQQQKIRIYHGAKQSAVWRTDSLASNPSINRSGETGSTDSNTSNTSRGSGGSSVYYATTPSLLQRKISDSAFNEAAAMPRRVSFPESDKELVTGYLEPTNPWEKVYQVSSIAEITELYVQSCYKHHTQPLQIVMEHLSGLDLQLMRQPLLSLKGVQLTPNDCEPLEEIFKLIQYKAIDFSECPLDESCLRALCEMIDYYEAVNELDISYNKEQMTLRGWGHCTHMIKRSQELQLLNAEGNQISKVGAENLGIALSTSNLHTLKLEHCGLKGPPLTSFCCKLYHNKILKELWLGYNDLDCTDAQHIADMLRFNHTIELIDISNNNIRDEGVMYLVQALIMQATELERRSGLPLKRTQAIEDDEPMSPAETSASSLSMPSHNITPSTEAKTVEPNETCVQNNNNANSHNNTNNTNNNNINNNNNNNTNNKHNNNIVLNQIPEAAAVGANSSGSAAIYEVTAEESDCINGIDAGPSGSRPLDMNKNAKAGDDFEDTHSTYSAFESTSEGDISRHLPDEFSSLSVSLESTRLDDLTKEMAIETATIASESTECLLVAEEAGMPPASVEPEPKPETAEVIVATMTPSTSTTVAAVSKVTIDAKEKEPSASPCPSPTPTPPPPSTSPGGVSSGLRRTESSCAYLNQSTRNRSQSSDSLCSENSLDGSTSSVADPHLAEKLTKNDTLSRRHLVDATLEAANRPPSGLKALALWSNNLSKDCGPHIAELLSRSSSLELLNIGKNCLSNDFVATIKDSLTKNTALTTLGLQSAHLSAKGIETLASILTFGGNRKLQRIDIRDNKLEVESLNIIAEVLKSNKTVTQIDINDEPKRLTIGSDAHLDYTRALGTVRLMCSRNEKMQAEELELAEKAANVGVGCSSNNNSNNSSSNNSNNDSSSSNGKVSNISSSNNINRCRGGYYLGSRKISLTCHSRPLVDAATGTVTAALAVTAMPTPAAKLEARRKTNARLRSPGPSPPTISPSSSPNRSRFHVSRVSEISSPLTSPLAQMPPQTQTQTATTTMTMTTTAPRLASSSCMSIPGNSNSNSSSGSASASGSQSSPNALLPLPTSSSLPSMASVTSSVQTVKRLSVSPRSRFHVSRIYEDPLTPPMYLPPTPMLKSARKSAQLAEAQGSTTTATTAVTAAAMETAATTVATAAAAASPVTAATTTTTAMPISSVTIVEPSPTAVAAATDENNDNENAHHQPSTNGDEAAAQKLSPNSPSTSSSSCSTSPTSSATNSSNNSSSSYSDVTDGSSCSSSSDLGPLVAAKSCPIAVFGDNDITLTKESAASVALSAVATNNNATNTAPTVVVQSQPQPPTTRARKASWIANPTTVDKLLTLFNPSTMFQRSSSPESKSNAASAASQLTNTNAQS
ncbi:GH13582 [Drosophila grimshawi]|uniref:GH13582 n=1 Tax=Drosophila grimshawi TaxID=7222 RepID=B4JPT5_DROGR|nr:GH13582 [Drosophila grimshawi]